VVAVRANPNDPAGNLLIVAGGDEDSLVQAADTLAMHHAASVADLSSNGAPQGTDLQVNNFKMPAARQVDDAPRWLPPSKATPLGTFSTPAAMQSDGTQPIPIYFRVPPDQFYGEKQNLALHLGYRYNAAPLAAGSTLRVYLNSNLVAEIPLTPGSDFNDHGRYVVVPVEFMRPSSNTLLFSYDLVLKPGNTVQPFGSILPWTSLDTSGLPHWTRMPNLELFANAGFPYTRLSDLAETVVVMPSVPSTAETELYLMMMSHSGQQTGTPALRVTVTGPDATLERDRDYLVIGAVSDQPAFSALNGKAAVTFDSDGIHVTQKETMITPLERKWASWSQVLAPAGLASSAPVDWPSNVGGAPDMMVEGLESPASPGRSIVLMEMKDDAAVAKFADAFLLRAQSSDLHGSVGLLRWGKFTSYDIPGNNYFIGNITWYTQMRIWMAQYYWALLVVVMVLSLLLGGWVVEALERKAAMRLQASEDL